MKHVLFATILFGMPTPALSAIDATPAETTRVIVLGVDHAAQLVSPNDTPAMLAAFLDRAKPDAICIERSPEAFARNDYYEFTYEVQDVVVPFARRKGIDLCPIDWEPPIEDAKLGFDMDLGAVPEVRPEQGFQQFLTFPRPEQLERDVFHADDPANLARVTRWATTPATRAVDDLPRRLYLYRTYLQAKRVLAAARAHVGGTVVLVVGEFHKRDIEAILGDVPEITIVQPSEIGRPSDEQVALAERHEYRMAIASFNILGLQADSGNLDHAFVNETMHALDAALGTPETQLLMTRWEAMQNRISPQDAISRYTAIADQAGDARFTWTGVMDHTRLDSYFDPFGNLSVAQRALLESARALVGLGRVDEAERVRAQLASTLTAKQARQLDAYWTRYIAPARPASRS